MRFPHYGNQAFSYPFQFFPFKPILTPFLRPITVVAMLASKATRPMVVKRPMIQSNVAFAPFRPHIRLPMFAVGANPCRVAS